MRFQDSVFSQLLKALPSHQLERLIKKHNADFRVRKLGCREQLIALIYGQLTSRKSLRDIEVSFNANRNQFYHLGCRSEIKKSTLSDANNKRPVALYEELFQWFVTKGLSGHYKQEASRAVNLIDATTVTLNKTRFGWARGHDPHSGIKVHTVYDLDAQIPVHFEITPSKNSDLSSAKKLHFEPNRYYVFDRGYYDFQFWRDIDASNAYFVTRLKKNSPTTILKSLLQKNTPKDIVSDNEVALNKRLARSRKNPYDKTIRELEIKVEGKSEPMRIITNDFVSSADDIAGLYKKRWQIELFFKWIKQNLKIKNFYGHSENAVKIQVLVAMISFILLRLFGSQAAYRDVHLLTLSRIVETCLMRRIDLHKLLHPDQYLSTKQSEQVHQSVFNFA